MAAGALTLVAVASYHASRSLAGLPCPTPDPSRGCSELYGVYALIFFYQLVFVAHVSFFAVGSPLPAQLGAVGTFMGPPFLPGMICTFNLIFHALHNCVPFFLHAFAYPNTKDESTVSTKDRLRGLPCPLCCCSSSTVGTMALLLTAIAGLLDKVLENASLIHLYSLRSIN